MAKRQDIETLQTTLMSIIQHSSSKTINVEELKAKLVESLKKDKYAHPFSSSGHSEFNLKKTKKSGSRAKSPVRLSALGH